MPKPTPLARYRMPARASGAMPPTRSFASGVLAPKSAAESRA
jgi:hypothetical protein